MASFPALFFGLIISMTLFPEIKIFLTTGHFNSNLPLAAGAFIVISGILYMILNVSKVFGVIAAIATLSWLYFF